MSRRGLESLLVRGDRAGYVFFSVADHVLDIGLWADSIGITARHFGPRLPPSTETEPRVDFCLVRKNGLRPTPENDKVLGPFQESATDQGDVIPVRPRI